jgi:hypothetical protein
MKRLPTRKTLACVAIGDMLSLIPIPRTCKQCNPQGRLAVYYYREDDAAGRKSQ